MKKKIVSVLLTTAMVATLDADLPTAEALIQAPATAARR